MENRLVLSNGMLFNTEKPNRVEQILDYIALTDLMTKQPRLGYVLMREIAKIEGRRLQDMDQKSH